MRVLVFAIPEKGHTNPLLPTVRHLLRRGHDVIVASFGDITTAFADAGLPVRCQTLQASAQPSTLASERVTRGKEFAERLREPAWLSRWVQALLVDTVPAQLPAVAACLAQHAPDVVIADPMMYAAAIGCARARLPWAGVSSSLNPVTPSSWHCDLTQTLARIDERRHKLFRDNDVTPPRFFVSDAESPWLNVVFTVEEYAPRGATGNERVFMVGAPFDDEDRERRDGPDEGECEGLPWESGAPHRPVNSRPRVYCSFGSQAFHQPALFAAVFAAAQNLSLDVIASVGDLVDDLDFCARAPRTAILVRSAPQLRVLPLVDVVVSHGGANSAVESLAHGLPLVLLPLCNDQPLQGRFLAQAGAGVVVTPERADAQVLADALALASSEDVRARAQHIGERLRAAGGPARTAMLIEQLASERTPMAPI